MKESLYNNKNNMRKATDWNGWNVVIKNNKDEDTEIKSPALALCLIC